MYLDDFDISKILDFPCPYLIILITLKCDGLNLNLFEKIKA